MTRSITMKDIAKKAGVNQSTVSRILNNQANLYNEDTINKVHQAIKDLNYQPNQFAKTLKTGKTNLIGVTSLCGGTGHMDLPYPAKVYKGMGNYFRDQDYKMLFHNFQEFPGPDQYRDLVDGGLVDGLLFLLFSSELEKFREKEVARLKEKKVPFVVVHSLGEDMGYNSVGLNCRQGGKRAVEHLLNLGHTSIALVGSKRDLAVHRDLLEGCRETVPVRDDLFYKAENETLDAGYALAGTLISSDRKLPDVFLAADEKIAVGMMKRFREAGVSVPNDTAVMAFGDENQELAEAFGLTCIKQPAEEKGFKAARMLHQVLKNQGPGDGHYTEILDAPLVIRTSCGAGTSH